MMPSLALAIAIATAVATVQAPQPAAPPPCTAAEFRQFDFWLGTWEVVGPKEQRLGTNRIELVEQGCALAEHWTGAGGGTGRSLNAYDPNTRGWRQFWVSSGGTLWLAGGMRNGSMVLEGRRQDAKGAAVRDRITWTPRPDGTVRQHWEQSRDAGNTWTTAFDGTYKKARAASAPHVGFE